MEQKEYELMGSVEEHMWWYRAVHALLLDILRRHASRPGARVLDAGCGTGGLLLKLSREATAPRAFGVDLEPLACRFARQKSGRPVAGGTLNALPFASGTFDAIFSIDVLCHRSIDEPAALAEAHRCLRPGGILVLNLPAFQWLRSTHDELVHTSRRYDAGGVKRLLASHGFTPLGAGYWNTLLFPLMVLRRKVFRPRDLRSDVREYPWLVDRCFGAFTTLERAILRAGLRLPFGGSVLAVGSRS